MVHASNAVEQTAGNLYNINQTLSSSCLKLFNDFMFQINLNLTVVFKVHSHLALDNVHFYIGLASLFPELPTNCISFPLFNLTCSSTFSNLAVSLQRDSLDPDNHT